MCRPGAWGLGRIGLDRVGSATVNARPENPIGPGGQKSMPGPCPCSMLRDINYHHSNNNLVCPFPVSIPTSRFPSSGALYRCNRRNYAAAAGTIEVSGTTPQTRVQRRPRSERKLTTKLLQPSWNTLCSSFKGALASKKAPSVFT